MTRPSHKEAHRGEHQGESEAEHAGIDLGAEGPIGLSRAILIWERFEGAFWKPVSFLLLCAAIALTGILPSLDTWLHAGLLILALVIFVALLVQGANSFSWPDRAQARRRIELVNKLDHRPLETLSDRPSGDDPIQQALWQEHRRRIAARIRGLSVGTPTAQLAGRDPRGLRLIAGFLFIAALWAVGGKALDNLAASMVPQFGTTRSATAVAMDAWLAPPDYTGLPPLFIARGTSATGTEGAEGVSGTDLVGPDHSSPVGSRLVVQVSGAREGAELVTPYGRFPMARFADDAVAIDHKIEKSGVISVVADGEELASWTLHMTPDLPPVVTLPEPPTPSLRRALTIHHTVSDDFEVVSLAVQIERADRPVGSAQASPYGNEVMMVTTPLPVPGPDKYGVPRRAFRDYTAHPWAGGKVRLTLVATDALGQEGRTEPVELILPDRKFNHPVAQIIVDLRRDLAWDPLRNFAAVSEVLAEVANKHDLYGDDVTVFLALKEASRQLAPSRRGHFPPSSATIDAMIELLWKTALYLEDGGVSLSLARLRAAESALLEALANGAEASELEQLMDDLQDAMRDYMKAMSEQLSQRMSEGEPVPNFDPEANIISDRDLDSMLDQMREMLRNGMTDSAAQMLAQLQQMMENMQAGVQAQMSPENQNAMKMLEDMQQLMEGQRELMDRTHKQAQQGGGQQGQQRQQGQRKAEPGQKPQDGTRGQGQNGDDGPGQQGMPNPDAVLQDALRRQLGEIMRQYGEMMGDIPEAFGRADEGMADAIERLGSGDPGEAVDAQGQAMDALQDAAQAARNAFMERFQNQLGMSQTTPGASGQRSMDPFGRQASETFRGSNQGETTVPSEESLDRAREIRNELRRRAGDRSRPPSELDYIDRLLDQFR